MNNLEEKEYNNTYAIPANYTDSGKLLGGMLETRNTIEAVLLVGALGYAEIAWLPGDTIIKVVIITMTIIPLAVVALMGVGGNSLLTVCHPHRALHAKPKKTAL